MVKKKKRKYSSLSLSLTSPLKQWSIKRNFEKWRFRGVLNTLTTLSTITETEKESITKALKVLSKVDTCWDIEREIAKADFLRGGK